MSMSFLCGSLFAVAGLALFLAQVLTVELTKAYKKLRDCIEASFGHDTSIFPDHIP
jgi:hypothetical protein